MYRVVLTVIELALLIYCLIDAIQSPSEAVRNLPKWAWIILVLFFPFVGGIAWLIVGRPTDGSALSGPGAFLPQTGQRSSGQRMVAPDDDPDFLRGLDKPRQPPRDVPREKPRDEE